MEDWFTIDDIELSDDQDTLYCIAVDSDEHQFLAGNIDVPTHNTDEGKEQDELKGEAQMIIGSIARLGRAAGVHMVIATQRPDASILGGETRDNLAVRLGCGPLQPNASSMLFASSIGQRIRSNPKGGIYLQIHGKGNMGQGFFAPSDWLDKYYEEHPEVKDKVEGVHDENASAPDSEMTDIPQSEGKARKKSVFEDDWDADMDAIYEVAHDNDDPDNPTQQTGESAPKPASKQASKQADIPHHPRGIQRNRRNHNRENNNTDNGDNKNSSERNTNSSDAREHDRRRAGSITSQRGGGPLRRNGGQLGRTQASTQENDEPED